MVCRVRRRFATCESGESSPHSKGFAPATPTQCPPANLASRNDSPAVRGNMLPKHSASTAPHSATPGTTHRPRFTVAQGYFLTSG